MSLLVLGGALGYVIVALLGAWLLDPRERPATLAGRLAVYLGMFAAVALVLFLMSGSAAGGVLP